MNATEQTSPPDARAIEAENRAALRELRNRELCAVVIA